MSTAAVILIGLAWILTGIIGMVILAIAHDANKYDRIFAAHRSQRCRACIAENPDAECAECGWMEAE